MYPKPRVVENHNFDFARPENRNLVQWDLFLLIFYHCPDMRLFIVYYHRF